ncbi:hypothetical protein T08_826 [Trichinella sp. T8]|nr:hypothetical protein T08_826 [Trichinella sp. T8]
MDFFHIYTLLLYCPSCPCSEALISNSRKVSVKTVS